MRAFSTQLGFKCKSEVNVIKQNTLHREYIHGHDMIPINLEHVLSILVCHVFSINGINFLIIYYKFYALMLS